MREMGIALATAISAWVNTLLLFILLRMNKYLILDSKLIINTLKKYSDGNLINEDTEIITSDIIDSFALIQLIFDLKIIFKIKINAEELNIENFQNPKTILKFIKKIDSND